MSVWTNAQLVYGLVESDVASQILEKFSDKVEALKEQYHIEIERVVNGKVEALWAQSFSASAKSYSRAEIASDDLTKTAEYDQRIESFLKALNIETEEKPQWHLLAYVD